MRLGIFLVVSVDAEEEADTRFDCRCCYTAAVAEEGSHLDLPERAVAAEGGMTAEVEQSQARSGEVGKIGLGYHVNEYPIMYCNDLKYQV